MRGIGETPEERYGTLERIAKALERMADAEEERNREIRRLDADRRRLDEALELAKGKEGSE